MKISKYLYDGQKDTNFRTDRGSMSYEEADSK